ncbi:MAG: phosphatidate cytidylyltransferase [Ruminococcaceae bacterium]|nr:phosphatidate cytidylyltransferase [Oscillospiraceae bacterium]
MKSRILVACVCIPLLLVAFYLLPVWVTVLLIALVSTIATYELMNCLGIAGNRRILVYCLIVSFAVPFWCWLESPAIFGTWVVFSLFLLLFIEAIFSKKSVEFGHVAAALFSALLLPYFLSAFVRLRIAEYGEMLILLPLVIAFIADAAALFAGMLFGKHKLAPEISPKKTVEGAIGGLLGGLIGCVIYAFVAELIWGINTNVFAFAVYGAVGSVISVIGDLSFSLIKRQYGIKDYGSLLPGHGGILDRFDSVIFTAPLVEILLAVLPAVI